MSWGMRVWNASGDITLDVTDRLTRIVGRFVLSVPPNVSGWLGFPVPGMALDGTWGAFLFNDRIAYRMVSGSFQVFVTTAAQNTRAYPFIVFRC